ncbi:MAG: ribulose bisphosphate carboxylase small subunit [Gammaproteobacteria bacterium]|jgi:ribulose-bisphosphate carboxylase small chain|nr:ribulose bisphosphate carboxylase small subunit [Pseudomonadota bacterium]
MPNIQDYPSRLNTPASIKFETFSYLPKMDAERIRAQVVYIVEQGWNPAIEHVEPDRSGDDYWYMWKLPMFGEKDVDAILREAAECHKANPNNHVRLIGYDNLKQTQGASMVVYRAKGF